MLEFQAGRAGNQDDKKVCKVRGLKRINGYPWVCAGTHEFGLETVLIFTISNPKEADILQEKLVPFIMESDIPSTQEKLEEV